MVNDWTELYGSYSIPNAVYELLRLEKSLQEEDLSFEAIGLIPITDNYTYTITPPDLIPFARTGGAGIHFGFLTEFNKVEDLMEAPIVCVSPTNDPPIRYMARNIKEFINLAISVPYVEMLEQFWETHDENQMKEIVREYANDLPDALQRKRAFIYKRLQDTFKAEPVDVLTYIHQVKMERAKKICMLTLDGLGIIGQHNGSGYSFPTNRNCDEKEIEGMRSFLHEASTEEKLAFIRDANYWYVLSSGYDEAVWLLIIELLQALKLQDEANRVLSKS